MCARAADAPFASLAGVPTHPNVLLPTAAEAVAAPRGDVALSLCRGCGLIWNTRFDPRALTYDAAYENSLHFSGEFNRYADALADQLVARHDLAGKRVAELGSGKGEFLAQLCERADCSGIGFDPSYAGESDGRAGGRVSFVRELFGPASRLGPVSLVVTRHVVEHLEDPVGVLGVVRRSLGERDAILYVEVPAAEYLLSEAAIWDVIYPHVTCFSASALQTTLVRAGFHPVRHGFSFAGQYLWMEASTQPVPSASVSPPLEPDELDVDEFGTRLSRKQAVWTNRLAGLLAEGPVALWGAGAKGATFLNVIHGGDAIDSVVDVNPRKAGRYVPGTGQPVISPTSLAEREPSAVVVMNPIYAGEIEQSLRDLGSAAEIVAA